MLNIGFDPSFIDTIVRAQNSYGLLIDTLPEPGDHHRISKINKTAGGNSVNISYTLKKLQLSHNLIIPSNDEFDLLLGKRKLKVEYKLHNQINETVAINWNKGEIQFNDSSSTLNVDHFTKKVYQYWTDSHIQCLLNLGLNHTSLEWLSCLWLSSCGWEFEDIKNLSKSSLISNAINEQNLIKPIILDPGSIKFHPNRPQLIELLANISQSNKDDIYPILINNNHEYYEYQKLAFPTKITHSAEEVIYKTMSNTFNYDVPKLDNIQTFVGAGDAFFAGILFSLYQSKTIDIEFAINIAQKYMTYDL